MNEDFIDMNIAEEEEREREYQQELREEEQYYEDKYGEPETNYCDNPGCLINEPHHHKEDIVLYMDNDGVIYSKGDTPSKMTRSRIMAEPVPLTNKDKFRRIMMKQAELLNEMRELYKSMK